MPHILLADGLLWKNNAPIMITKMGVRELRVPVRALSISSSAIQNKKAGNKLPNTPDKKMTSSLLLGISLKYLMADGSKTIPEKTIRRAATWNAVKWSKPPFIKMKLLPHIMESRMKMNQLKNPCFKIC